jgi:hypothetical protein
MSSRRRKNCKTNKWQEKRQTKEKLKLKTPPETNPPNTLNASSPPYVEFIMFLLSTTWLARGFYQLCAHSLPIWQ